MYKVIMYKYGVHLYMHLKQNVFCVGYFVDLYSTW